MPAAGAPELVQLLPPEGEPIEHPDYSADLSDPGLEGPYHDRVVVPRVDGEAPALQLQGELGICAALRGHEAPQVGSGRALVPDDPAFPTRREVGVAYCRGVVPLALLGLFC